jgi:hypothetical protein
MAVCVRSSLACSSLSSLSQRWDPRPGMCFVTYEHEKDAEAALAEYQDLEILPGHK